MTENDHPLASQQELKRSENATQHGNGKMKNSDVDVIKDNDIGRPAENNSSTVDILPEEKQTNGKIKDKKQPFYNKIFIPKKDSMKPQVVPYFSLFRYSTRMEKLMIIIACLCSATHGALFPLFTVFFGDIVDAFGPDTPPDVFMSKIKTSTLKMIYTGLGVLVSSFFQVALSMLSAQRQGRRVRKLYFRSLMSQEMGWYDGIVPAELTARVAGDVGKVEEGIGDKLGSCVQFLAMTVTGFSFGFAYGWKLALVILSVVPLLAVGGGTLAKWTATISSKGQTAYARAGGVAEETLSLIRTVVAFGGEERQQRHYGRELKGAYKLGIKQGNAQGVGLGFTMGIMICSYALGFWYGSILIKNGELTTGNMLTVFFSIVIGGMAIGQASPAITTFSVAQGAAYHLFEVIDRKPAIDTLSTKGRVLDTVNGEIVFDNVDFTYDSRDDKMILNHMCATIGRGKTLALVGQSGCGKSTMIQLLERFYDPLKGAVRLDGVDIRELNVQWYRSQIGIVSQMPTLFATTIAENIALGAGLVLNKDFDLAQTESVTNRKFVMAKVTQKQVEQAAKMANAHDFIMRLPLGYETVIGERGAQLSGGQKQRVAIARALVKNPKILLLDEATSALDSHSERIVQSALDNAAQGRTTVVVAHRLSTIKNADVIAVVEHGQIVEIGTNAQLMALPNGKYKGFVELQKLAMENAEDSQSASETDDEASEDSPLARTRRISERRLASTNRRVSTGRPVSTGRKVSTGGASVGRPGSRGSQAIQADDDVSSSESESEEDTVGGKKKKKEVAPGLFMTVLKKTRPDWLWILLGTVSSAINGTMWPLFSLVFAEVLGVILINDEDKIHFWVIMFVVVGLACFFSQWFAVLGFSVSGERMTLRMRQECFETIVHQPISWFDDHDNSVGSLSTRLSKDAADVKLVTDSVLQTTVTQFSSLATGLAIGFTATWKVSLVVLAMLPAMIFSAAAQMKQLAGFAAQGSKVYKTSGKIANEAVDNVRTVVALSAPSYFIDRYDLEVEKPSKEGLKASLVAGVGFAFSEFMVFVIWSVSLYYGGTLVEKGQESFTDIMKAVSAIIFGAMTAGQVAGMAPNAAKAKVAATSVFKLLGCKSSVDSRNTTGFKSEGIKGQIGFEKTCFEYPTRPDVPVLRGLTISAQSGQTLALVGESGCGKSTAITLLERFYDPSSGSATIDGVPVDKYNLRWLRSQIGIVNQEPDLFNTSIKENILYGLPEDRLSVVTEETVIAAAKLANAHSFISELPETYDYQVGERGYHLSGGQRQRIAIARALIRNPRILLLDEATSALDSESEKLVQVALDKAREGRTTLAIAHRLATIQDANVIAVIQNGVVAEKGTHNELLAKNGLYALMVENQRQET